MVCAIENLHTKKKREQFFFSSIVLYFFLSCIFITFDIPYNCIEQQQIQQTNGFNSNFKLKINNNYVLYWKSHLIDAWSFIFSFFSSFCLIFTVYNSVKLMAHVSINGYHHRFSVIYTNISVSLLLALLDFGK